MKDNLIEKLFKEANQIRLEKEKKNSVKENILAYMKANPLPRQSPQAAGLPVFQFFQIFKFKTAAFSFADLALIFLIGTFASASSDSALPGDALYSVKLGKEQVMAVLSFSDEAKIDLAEKLAERRLEEAEKLSVQGKINKEDRIKLSKNFSAQIEILEKKIESAPEFEESLKAKLEKKISAAEESVENAKKIIEEQKSEIDEEAAKQVENILKSAEKKITEGRDKIKSKTKDFGGSFSASQDAETSASELRNLIREKIKERLKLKINE